MKTDLSIKNIALASIHRHAGDVQHWKYTIVDPHTFPNGIEGKSSELPVVFVTFWDDDWTLITTQRIIGKSGDQLKEINFSEIDEINILLDNFKSDSTIKARFRINDICGQSNDFLMESGKASIASIYAIRTIRGLIKT